MAELLPFVRSLKCVHGRKQHVGVKVSSPTATSPNHEARIVVNVHASLLCYQPVCFPLTSPSPVAYISRRQNCITLQDGIIHWRGKIRLQLSNVLGKLSLVGLDELSQGF